MYLGCWRAYIQCCACRLILRRRRPISNIFGTKAHANVLKGTLSMDCKSNFVRIGLRAYFSQGYFLFLLQIVSSCASTFRLAWGKADALFFVFVVPTDFTSDLFFHVIYQVYSKIKARGHCLFAYFSCMDCSNRNKNKAYQVWVLMCPL